MIYEYRDSRDGHVFASEYGQSMSATKMMYTAMCHDVPMCRVEWRKYMEGFWSEWCPLVPDFRPAPPKAWWECLPAFAEGVAAYRRNDFELQRRKQQERDYIEQWWENYHAGNAAHECEHRYFVWGQRVGVILWTGIAICLIMLAFA